MTVIKKCIILSLVFTILLPSVGLLAFDGESKPLSNEDAAIIFLKAFDILPEELNSEEMPKHITRAQTAYALTSVTGTFSSDNNIFSDVADDYIYKDDISSVYNYGLMNGTGIHTFSPDENLTYHQAMKVLLSLSGYEKVIAAIDKTTIAYESYCKSLKILKNVAYNNVNDEISFEDFAIMLYNTLNASYNSINKIGDNKITFTNDNVSVLEKYMNIKKERGILQTVGNFRISYSHNTSPETITVSSVSYKNGYDKAKQYLGAEVYVYVDTDDKIVFAEPVKSDYNYVHVQSDDIEAISKSELRYFDSNTHRAKKYYLHETEDIIWNSMPLTSGTDYGKLIPEYGYIELFDYDCDDIYEVMSVHSYDLYYVETVSNGNEPVIVDKYTKKSLKLSDNDVDIMLSVEKDGNPSSIEYIESGMIVLAEVSDVQENKQVIKLYASDKSVDCGTTFAYDNDEVILGDSTYKINPHYADAIENSKYSQEIEPTFNTKFLLDSNGYIAASINKEEVLKYGYLFAAKLKKVALGSELLFRILETDNEFRTYKTVDRIKFNGVKVKADSLENSSVLFNNELTGTNQGVVRYSVNDDGLIDEFYTVGGTDGYGKLTLDRAAADRRVRNLVFVDPDFIAADFYATDSVIFNVPDTSIAANIEKALDEDNFTCVNGDNISDDATIRNVSAYNVDEAGSAAVVVMSNTTAYSHKYTPIIVDDVYYKCDKETGDTLRIAKVYKYNASNAIELEVSEGLEASKGKLQQGDVLIPVYSPDLKELIDYTRTFTYSRGMEPYSGTTVTGSPGYGCAEFVSTIGTKYMCLDWKNDINGDGEINADDYRFVKLNANASYFIYDVENETIKKGSSSDFVYGDKVFYYLMNFSPLLITIIKD